MSVRVIPQTAMQLHFHNTAAESRSRLHRPQALIVTSLQLSATAQLFGENFDEAPTSHKKEPLNVRQIWLLSSQSLVPSKTFLLSFTAVRGGMQQHLHQQQAQKAMGAGPHQRQPRTSAHNGRGVKPKIACAAAMAALTLSRRSALGNEHAVHNLQRGLGPALAVFHPLTHRGRHAELHARRRKPAAGLMHVVARDRAATPLRASRRRPLRHVGTCSVKWRLHDRKGDRR